MKTPQKRLFAELHDFLEGCEISSDNGTLSIKCKGYSWCDDKVDAGDHAEQLEEVLKQIQDREIKEAPDKPLGVKNQIGFLIKKAESLQIQIRNLQNHILAVDTAIGGGKFIHELYERVEKLEKEEW